MYIIQRVKADKKNLFYTFTEKRVFLEHRHKSVYFIRAISLHIRIVLTQTGSDINYASCITIVCSPLSRVQYDVMYSSS